MPRGTLPRLVSRPLWRSRRLRAVGWNWAPPSRLRADVHEELFHRGLAAFSSEGSAGLLHLLAPDVEVDQTVETLGAVGRYHGHAGFVRMMEEIHDAFDQLTWTLERATETRPRDQMLVVVRLAGAGRGSGVPISTSLAMLWTLRSGWITRLEVYRDEEEAATAAARPR